MKRLVMTAAAVAVATGLGSVGGSIVGSVGAKAANIGIALSSDTNPFYIAMLNGMKKRAEALGHKVSVVNAEEDIAKQLNGINDLIAQKVDGILISPIDARALCSAYTKAKKAGIPMMSIARGSACKDQLLHIAIDEVKVGGEIAAWTAKKIGGKGDVAVLAGPAGAQAFINLAKGYTAEMAKHPGIKIVFRHEMLLTRENGLKFGEDALVAHPNLKAIYGANDEIGLGAAQAVVASGLKGKVVVTGMNGIPPARFAVKRGTMGLTVALNPVAWGNLGMNTMDAQLKGKAFDKKVFVRHLLLDSANVDKLLPKKKK